MLSKFFIERPVLANVIALLMMLIGAVSIFGLPISQYPDIVPPTIQVTTRYPGASATLVQQLVASNIETQVNGVDGMLYMESSSTNDGNYTLTVTFKVGTDPDLAQVNVQNRVAIAVPSLPQAVQKQGVTTRTQSTAILQFVTLTSSNPDHDGLFLSNLANLKLQQRLARIPGVAAANVFGVGNYSMRVWLDPAQLKMRNLTPNDVISAINRQNILLTSGQIGAPPTPLGQDFQLTLNVTSAMTTPEQFGRIVVKTGSKAEITYLRDIARIEMGSQNYSQFFKIDERAAGGIAIYQMPGANAIATANAVRTEMQQIQKTLPKEVSWAIPFDTTMFVQASIHEVYKTLYEAGILVLLVIMIFLQNWRATLVPATTVPVTIIGAFACMAALGFSINLLTLFAIVLCIGIVVDDAIVVVEAVSKKVEEGESPRQGAIDAMTQLMGPIIGITLVLMAVFIPASFISGITGQMYRQFALVIAATALISGINAITLKPTQSAQYLKPIDPNLVKNKFYQKFDLYFNRLSTWYEHQIQHLMNHRAKGATVGIIIIIASLVGLMFVPSGFIPNEDQGYLVVSTTLPDAASLQRTEAGMKKAVDVLKKIPGVDTAVVIGGINLLNNSTSQSNSGAIYVIMKKWDERGKGEDLRSIYMNMNEGLKQVQELKSFVLLPPAIPGLGLSGGFEMRLMLTDGSNNFAKLDAATKNFIDQAQKLPEIMAAFTPFQNNVPQLELSFNVARAETVGVAIGDAYDVLQSYVGSTYVNQFFKYGQTYQVYVQADGKYRSTVDQLNRLYVKNKSGSMVPLGSFIDVKEVTGPAFASQFQLYPSAAVLGAAKDGYSSGEAIKALEALANRTLPDGVTYQWAGMSYQEKLVGNTVILIFALSILLVYLVLAAQYETWIAPLAVLTAVPLSLSGTVIALLLTGLPNNIYVQIGLVLMIALSCKNSILIVEVAIECRQKGMSFVDAALEASKERFRPIVMTSIAFILGVMPLLMSTGAGAAARISLGITVFSGMIASTCLAVALVPIFYVEIETFFENREKKKQEKIEARKLASN
ncbi:efflux RND transporter permease subunit [Polynucleobacter sp. MWH-Svant-W18]|uniref:efflux RND transporter permease subunit n=1 Tax=Polynucleobacter sp. MWH-Svant-W18 TaxID=1855909 RepID=UPI001BFE75A8|nr:efflux RND transporter permease subunit [Polynucleobacter sp. MWH-Svant-W18]QWD77523.1 efflux RND transporter permease subunit [Polynucleobacter sp. MWH-Svant-W18]